MCAWQARQRQVHQAVLVLVDHAPVFLVRHEILSPDRGGRAEFRGALLDDVPRLFGLGADDAGCVGLDDAGLFARDQGYRIAEKGLVVEVDGRDDGRGRLRDDVGGVIFSAEADLEDQHVGLVPGEGQHGGGRRDLEEGDGRAFIAGFAFLQQGGEFILVDELAAQANALVEAHQVRGAVDMYALAGGLEHGPKEGAGRSLAVGSRDMDHRWQAQMGGTQLLQQGFDPAQRQVDELWMKCCQAGKDGVACQVATGLGRHANGCLGYDRS